MVKEYNELTAIEVDANLHYDTLVQEEKIKRYIFAGIILLIFIFRGFITYWLKFGIAIPSEYTYDSIITTQDPVQINYTEEEKISKTFTYHSLINKNTMEVIPQAHYVLSAMVVSTNHDFLFISKFFDSAALYDLGATWGNLADKNTYKRYFKSYNTKIELTGARKLYWSWRYDTPYDASYIQSHISHSHIIPANRNIMAAMLKLKQFQIVKIEGELVDMNYYDKSLQMPMRYYTSLSRTDVDENSRGSGACETIYVTKIQIGDKIYK